MFPRKGGGEGGGGGRTRITSDMSFPVGGTHIT